jgi:hypothetical protein
MIAGHMQEQAFGGLDRESLSFLDGLARHGGSPRRRRLPSSAGSERGLQGHFSRAPVIVAFPQQVPVTLYFLLGVSDGVIELR